VTAVPITLPDGREARLRPIVPADAAELVAEFERLSPASRLARFLSPIKRLSDALVKHFTTPDGVDHLAYVLVVSDRSRPCGERGLGVARALRDPNQDDLAEFACTIAEGEQGKGLGTVLMRHLAAEALRVGIDRLYGVMWADNLGMMRVMDHLGPETQRVFEGCGVVRVTYRIAHEKARPSAPPTPLRSTRPSSRPSTPPGPSSAPRAA
jgi:RimJ/RimL family protein N-acetyltransferase